MTSKIKTLENRVIRLECATEYTKETIVELRAVVALTRESLKFAEFYQAQRAWHALGAVLTMINEIETTLEESNQ